MTKWGPWAVRLLIVIWVLAAVHSGVSDWTDHVPVSISTPPPAGAAPGTLPVESAGNAAFSCAAPLASHREARQDDRTVIIVETQREPCSYRRSMRIMMFVDIAVGAIGLLMTSAPIRRRTANAGSRAWRLATDRPAHAPSI